MRLSDAMRYWLLGVMLLISGITTFILYTRSGVFDRSIPTIFCIVFGIWLIIIGIWSIYLSVMIKHHPVRTFEEQLDEVLDKPLPKRWRNE